jgi:superfamily II DNA/RNA helicase
MDGYDLPPLQIHEHRLGISQATIQRSWSQGLLIPDTNPNSTTLHRVKRESLDDRVNEAVSIVAALPPDEPVILWCDTNYEADALKKVFSEATDVRGSDTVEQKETRLEAFSDGKIRLLITKPEIAGFGLNWQHVAHMVFVGVSFSFERTYQALRRSYRFGQTRPVHAHMIYAESEGNVRNILKEKQIAFTEMQIKMNAAVHEHGLFRDDQNPALTSALGRVKMQVPNWLVSNNGQGEN